MDEMGEEVEGAGGGEGEQGEGKEAEGKEEQAGVMGEQVGE